MVDLLGARVSMYPAQVPTSKTHVEAGRLRALATASPRRVAVMPSVATLGELGLPGAEVESTYAFFAPRATSADRLERWNREIGHVLQDPQVRAQLAALGLEPAGGSRERLEDYIVQQAERWGELIRSRAVNLG